MITVHDGLVILESPLDREDGLSVRLKKPVWFRGYLRNWPLDPIL